MNNPGYMPEQLLKIRQFQSLDDFRQWWWSDEVSRFCQDHPEQVDALKAHRFVKPYLDELERESIAGSESQPLPLDKEIPPHPSTSPSPQGGEGRDEGEKGRVKSQTFGKYQLENKLGQGGMGAVYLAFDPTLNRRVALKIMTLKGIEAVERFQREARASAKLKHPNITPVYEVGTHNKFHYFTMEYVAGASMDGLIQSKRLNSRRAAEIIHDIALALDYAHKQKIIHRDIKPANILIDKGGQVYLTDFGLAKETTGIDKSLTLSGTVVGTPDYMSPEQARGEKHKIDPRSDIFSLGATLYHALTGHPPFRGKELYQVLEQVVGKDPIPPSRFVRALPGDLETICLKCMEKDPLRRYQTGRQLADDLSRFLKGDVILAKPASAVTKFWVKAKKNKLATIGIAGAAVILLIVIIGLTASSAGQRKEIESHRAEAEKAFEEKDYDKAKEWCTKLLTLAPDDEAIKGILKKCEKELNKQKAQADKDKAEAKDKAERDKLRAEAKAVLDRASAAKTAEEKIRIAQDALDKDPTYADAYQAIGYAYKDKLDYDKAYEYFTKAIEANPKQAYSYYERGWITADIPGKIEEAVKDFEQVLKYDPDGYMGWAAKARIQNEQKKYDESIESSTRAIELNPDCVIAYHNRGFAYNNKGEYDKAIADYNEAIRLDPKYATAYNNRGIAYYNKGEYDKAMTDYTEAIRLDPKSAVAYHNRGSAYKNKGEYDKAIADYNEAIRLDPKYATAYGNRSIVYSKKGDYKRAIADGERFLELAPNDPQAEQMRKLIAEWRANRAKLK